MKKIILILLLLIFNVEIYSQCPTVVKSGNITLTQMPMSYKDSSSEKKWEWILSNRGAIVQNVKTTNGWRVVGIAGSYSMHWWSPVGDMCPLVGSVAYIVDDTYQGYDSLDPSNCSCVNQIKNAVAPWTEILNYYTIPNCDGYDNEAYFYEGTDCWELGLENPAKPKYGIPTQNGIWVKLVNHYKNGYGEMKDSVRYDVVSGGCSGVVVDNVPLVPRRAENRCTTIVIDMQPQYKCVCINDDGTMINGTCESNGIDTGCGGINSFTYGSNNDSIILPCSHKNELPDSIPNVNPNDSNYVPDGINKLLEGQKKQNELQGEANGILGGISKILKSWGGLFDQMLDNLKSIKNGVNTIDNTLDMLKNHIDSINGLGGSDSSYLSGHDSILTNQEGLSVDTSGGGVFDFDSTGILSGIKNKYHVDSFSNDTNIIIYDSSDVAPLFEMFKIDQDTTCDCDPEWFVLNLMGQDIPLNICQYPLIAEVVRLILNTYVVFMLSWVGWNFIQRLLTETFT